MAKRRKSHGSGVLAGIVAALVAWFLWARLLKSSATVTGIAVAAAPGAGSAPNLTDGVGTFGDLAPNIGGFQPGYRLATNPQF